VLFLSPFLFATHSNLSTYAPKTTCPVNYVLPHTAPRRGGRYLYAVPGLNQRVLAHSRAKVVISLTSLFFLPRRDCSFPESLFSVVEDVPSMGYSILRTRGLWRNRYQTPYSISSSIVAVVASHDR